MSKPTRRTLPNRKDIALAGSDESQQLNSAFIRDDGGTQMRGLYNQETVQAYHDEFKRAQGWKTFPPIDVYYDGSTYWLADGFHRLAAFKRYVGFAPADVPAIVHAGTRRDAILHAAGANADHGLRRTNEDKRRAVTTLLRDEEWSTWSDAKIARRCKVDPKTVGNIRRELTATMEIPESTVRKTADGREIDTRQIGRVRQPKPAPAVEPAKPVYVEDTKPPGRWSLVAALRYDAIESRSFEKALEYATTEQLQESVDYLATAERKDDAARGAAIERRLKQLQAAPAAVSLNRDWSQDELDEYEKANEVVTDTKNSQKEERRLTRESNRLVSAGWGFHFKGLEGDVSVILPCGMGTLGPFADRTTAVDAALTAEQTQARPVTLPAELADTDRCRLVTDGEYHYAQIHGAGNGPTRERFDSEDEAIDWLRSRLATSAKTGKPDEPPAPVRIPSPRLPLPRPPVDQRLATIEQMESIFAKTIAMLSVYERETGDFARRKVLQPELNAMRTELRNLRTILQDTTASSGSADPDGGTND